MTVRAFVDTNIVVYAESADGDKTGRAVQIVESLPVISTQVVNETISVLTRRHGFSLAEAYEVAESLETKGYSLETCATQEYIRHFFLRVKENSIS